jgi:hypothetical protein
MPSSATPAAPGSDSHARLGACKAEVQALGAALVELDGDPTVALLGAANLTGHTKAAWEAVRTALENAWGTYRAARELVDGIAASKDDPAPALAAATLPAGAGPAPAEAAIRSAAAAVATAASFVGSIRVAWDDWTGRVQAAKDQIVAANPAAPDAASADALLDLLMNDPFAVNEADLTGVEAAARATAERAAADERAVSRLRLDLDQARAMSAALRDQHPRAVEAIDQATDRICGFRGEVPPASDIAQLEQWLDRVVTTADRDPEAAARALVDWRAAAQARIDELSAVEQAATSALERRKALRGRWQAYKSKAGDLGRDEQPQVTAALAALQERLWTAPCDLAAAERQLVDLARLLDRGEPRRREE